LSSSLDRYRQSTILFLCDLNLHLVRFGFDLSALGVWDACPRSVLIVRTDDVRKRPAINI